MAIVDQQYLKIKSLIINHKPLHHRNSNSLNDINLKIVINYYNEILLQNILFLIVDTKSTLQKMYIYG